MSEITEEQIVDFFEFLQGNLPDGMIMANRPKLPQRKAFKVIWYLQEHLSILPDKYEQCKHCGYLFNSNATGVFIDSECAKMPDGKKILNKYVGHYHDGCCPIDFRWI